MVPPPALLQSWLVEAADAIGAATIAAAAAPATKTGVRWVSLNFMMILLKSFGCKQNSRLEQESFPAVRIELGGRRGVIDLDVAWGLADRSGSIAGARLLRLRGSLGAGSGRCNRRDGDRCRDGCGSEQRCDMNEVDAHGRTPLLSCEAQFQVGARSGRCRHRCPPDSPSG